MAATAGAGHLAAFWEAQFMFRDANGYPKGTLTVPDTVTPATTTHSYILPGPVSSTTPQPTREIASFQGGQKILGQLALGISSFGTAELVLSPYNEVFNAYITGSVADATTNTSRVYSSPNVNNAILPQGFLILTMTYQTTPGGVNKFAHLCYNNCQIYPPGIAPTQASGTNPNPSNHTIVPTMSTRMHNGLLYSATLMALVDNSDLFSVVRSDYRMGVTVFVADTGSTGYVLSHRPVSSDTTNARNITTKNGVLFTPTSISTTTGAVVIPAATAGDIYITDFETNRIAI